jgi:phosphatidylglycerophosphate synthase
MQHYTYKEIRNTDGSITTWWEIIFLNRFVYRLTWILANYTRVTPNQITLASFMLCILSAYSFLYGTWSYMVFGAFLFEFSYILDCIDGRIARLKGLESRFGAYLDKTTDITKYFIIVICIVYGQYISSNDVSIFIYGYIFIFIHIMSMTGMYSAYSDNPNVEKTDTQTIIHNKFPFIIKLKKYIDPESRLSFIPLSATEAETIAFFIAPIIMEIKLGVILGLIIIFINILVSILFNFFIKK